MENRWIMDSGCSRHMTGNRKWFSSLTPMRSKEYIVFGDNGNGKVLGLGAVRISDHFTLREVALVDNLGFNLLSISQLLREGFEVRLKEALSCVFLMLKEILFVRFYLAIRCFGSISRALLLALLVA